MRYNYVDIDRGALANALGMGDMYAKHEQVHTFRVPVDFGGTDSEVTPTISWGQFERDRQRGLVNAHIDNVLAQRGPMRTWITRRNWRAEMQADVDKWLAGAI